jgi:SNF2 family DNA or RNA helicase
VLDEAQAIKNPDSQVAQAARALDAGFRLALTGTPVENRLEELWSAFHFVSPGLLGGRREFKDRFSGPIDAGDRRAQHALRRRIRPFVLRRLKSEVARDLPPRTDIILRCTLSEEERSTYEAVRALGRADVAKLLQQNRMLQVLEVLLRMRQAACHLGLLPGKTVASSSKLDLLLETLEEIVSEGHKALVFSQWTSMLDLVEPALRAAKIGYTRLDGSTIDRAKVVSEFSADDGPPVFLLSLKAGGTGLNLTAADYVFHLDPWWNPAVEDQATDRAHRIGQDRPVVSCRLIAEDTVEERILELQERKRGIARAALDEEALAKGITRDELMALFE